MHCCYSRLALSHARLSCGVIRRVVGHSTNAQYHHLWHTPSTPERPATGGSRPRAVISIPRLTAT